MSSACGGVPPDWSLTLDPTVRRADHGHLLIGGTPLRILRLSGAGASWLEAVVGGGQVGASPAAQRLARTLIDGGLAHPKCVGGGPHVDDVAVVIPVRDDAAGLARTLASVGPAGAVVVVDDGSAQPVAAGCRTIRRATAQGPAAARETGWRSTDSAFIAFVDADVELEEGWLARLLPHFGDKTVGAVAPRVQASVGDAPTWLAAYEARRSPFDRGALRGPVRPGARVSYVPTTALVVRRKALAAVGGFDTDLRVGEDVDLVWRLHEAGWRVRYEPAVHTWHPTRPRLGAWVRQRVRYGMSAAPLALRHGGAVAPLGISGWSAWTWLAVLFGRPIAAAAVGAGTTAALAPKLRTMEHPVREAVQLAGKGNLWAGVAVADALRRPWWPFAVAVGLRSRRARPALVAAAVVPPLLDRHAGTATLAPGRFWALRLLDDVAYGTGVWLGCLRHRSGRALLPRFSGPVPPPRTVDGPSR